MLLPLTRTPYVGPVVRPRGVVFDLFGALTVDQTPADRHAQQGPAAQALGVELDAFVRALRDSFTKRATGSWGDAAQCLGQVARQLGCEPSDAALAAAVTLRQEAERTLARPRPGALELLADLRANAVPVGVLSDCTWETVNVWPQLPYVELVDSAVFSVVLGARKPALVMYDEVAHRLSVDPDRLLYVGDGGSSELTGARRAGMRPVLLRESMDEPAAIRELRYDAEGDWDGEHVHDIEELRRFVTSSGLLGAR